MAACRVRVPPCPAGTLQPEDRITVSTADRPWGNWRAYLGIHVPMHESLDIHPRKEFSRKRLNVLRGDVYADSQHGIGPVEQILTFKFRQLFRRCPHAFRFGIMRIVRRQRVGLLELKIGPHSFKLREYKHVILAKLTGAYLILDDGEPLSVHLELLHHTQHLLRQPG